jgi:hypothetical protein
VFNLLTSPRRDHQSTSRRVLGVIASAVRSVVAPCSLFEAPAVLVTAPDPADVLPSDELPPVADIEAAAREFDRAADQARRADRGKRAARKVLDRLPAGTYGGWKLYRTPSSRQTPDLAAITATYKRLGLGPVPMKPCAASMKVERVTVAAAPTVLVAEAVSV